MSKTIVSLVFCFIISTTMTVRSSVYEDFVRKEILLEEIVRIRDWALNVETAPTRGAMDRVIYSTGYNRYDICDCLGKASVCVENQFSEELDQEKQSINLLWAVQSIFRQGTLYRPGFTIDKTKDFLTDMYVTLMLYRDSLR